MQSTGISLTIVVPTHHRPEMLRRCLAAIAKQTLPPSRVIVVGNEVDEGQGVCEEFNVEYCYIPDDPCDGRNPAAKRNYGVELADTDWVAFTDDDCVPAVEWIAGAKPYIEEGRYAAVEGQIKIPDEDVMTLTYKGLKRMEAFGGFQTANMFYNRKAFLDAGGFDLAFPFYLEDTDLAWTLLESGLEIAEAPGAVVEHPVVPPQPWRMLDNAKRVIVLPYFFKKHRKNYGDSGMRPFSRSIWLYLPVYAGVLVCLASGYWLKAALLLLVLVALAVTHTLWRYRGCRVNCEEILVSSYIAAIYPIVAVIQYARGCLRERVFLPPI